MKKRIKSLKLELVKKSREAMLAAVQIYNNPLITFKSETFISLAIIGWTYMLHAYYKENKVDFRYFHNRGNRKFYDRTKYGAYKHWELERCLNDGRCPLDPDTSNNLRFLIGIRHEIEHQMTNKIDEYLSAKLQACSINFDYYITTLFGKKYSLSNELALAIQFSPLLAEQRRELTDNIHITATVRNFITDFESDLSDAALRNYRYAYRVLFMPINVSRKNQADQVIEFIDSKSPIAQDAEKAYALIRETEKRKYLPSEIVRIMNEKGFLNFTMRTHTMFWKEKDAKNSKYSYGVKIANTWYWYASWLEEVEKYCEQNKSIFKEKR